MKLSMHRNRWIKLYIGKILFQIGDALSTPSFLNAKTAHNAMQSVNYLQFQIPCNRFCMKLLP